MTGAQAAVLVVAKVLVTDTVAVKEKSPHLSPRCGQDLRKYPLPQIRKPWFVSKCSSGWGRQVCVCQFHHFRMGKLLAITPPDQKGLLRTSRCKSSTSPRVLEASWLSQT